MKTTPADLWLSSRQPPPTSSRQGGKLAKRLIDGVCAAIVEIDEVLATDPKGTAERLLALKRYKYTGADLDGGVVIAWHWQALPLENRVLFRGSPT